MHNKKEKEISSLKTDYLVFVDECGDPCLHESLETYTNPSIPPIMTLVAVIVSTDSYRNIMMPQVNDIKNYFFGTENICFHSSKIRRKDGIFKEFLNPNTYNEFKLRMNNVLKHSSIQIVSCSIDKRKLYIPKVGGGSGIGDLYLKNTEYVLERVGHFLGDSRGKIIFETVGKRESRRIRSVLARIKGGGNNYNSPRTFRGINKEILFFTKEENINGLQIADYCAYPFFRHAKDGDSDENKFFDILKPYIHKGDYGDYGFKEWP